MITGAHRRARRLHVAAVLCAALVGVGSGGATAAFTATTSTSPGAFSSAAVDVTAPEVARTTVARTAAVPASSIAAGRFRQNAGYRVYAQVDDAVGVTSATANTTAIGGGSSTAPLSTSGGPFTVAGQSYNYASATLTAADVAATGVTKTYTVSAADAAANAVTTSAQNAVAETYAQAVASTSTVVGHWPLGSTTGAAASVLGSDDFTDTDAKNLTAHTSGTGSTWTQVSGTGSAQISNSSGTRVRQGVAGPVVATSSTVPASADYRVEADVVVRSRVGGTLAGVVGRRAPSGRLYRAFYENDGGDWNIQYCDDGGACEYIAYSAAPAVAGQSYRLSLEMQGTTLRLFVDSKLVLIVTDTRATAAGRGGVTFASFGAGTTATGFHLDDYAVTSLDARTTPSVAGSAPAGSITGGALLDQVGAIADDTGTAVGLDGVDDSVRVVRNAGNGFLVKDDFTLETWFRATAGRAADGNSWYDQKLLVDASAPGLDQKDFGTALRSDGRVTAGSGGDGTSYPELTIDSGATPTYAGATGWHHVVMTRVRATGTMTLYVDGVQRSTGSTTTASLDTSDALSFGAYAAAQKDPGLWDQFLAGAMDEVAVYSSPLTAAQVSDHYAAGKGTG